MLVRDNDDNLGSCGEGIFSKCPVLVAGYIRYLRNKGVLVEKLKEREEYRTKEKVNTFFDFFWEPKEYLNTITKEDFDIANNLEIKKALFKGLFY